MLCIDYSAPLDLFAVGGNDGRVEFWDADQKQKAHELTQLPGVGEAEITSI